MRTTVIDCLVVGSFTAAVGVGVVYLLACLCEPPEQSPHYFDGSRRLLYVGDFALFPLLALYGCVWGWLWRDWRRRDLPPDDAFHWLVRLWLVPWGPVRYYFVVVRPTIADPPKTAEERMAEVLMDAQRRDS